jgi:hypothetical protein
MSETKERVIDINEREDQAEERREEGLSTADFARRSETTSQVRAEERPNETPLVSVEKTEDFRRTWDGIQTSFVDQPREAVQKADSLVAEVMQHLATTFADERHNLERQWGEGKDVSTEDLRIALQRYRSFFSRLLSI